jgi:hypothetical protein
LLPDSPERALILAVGELLCQPTPVSRTRLAVALDAVTEEILREHADPVRLLEPVESLFGHEHSDLRLA